MSTYTQWDESELLPAEELRLRHERLRAELARRAPGAAGLFVASRLNIYYLSGTMANGLLWLPANGTGDGEPVLMVRKSLERARLESRLKHIVPFRSYRDIPALFEELGVPLGDTVAVESSGFSWALGKQFSQRLPEINLLNGDAALNACRSRKTPWEMEKMRAVCAMHGSIVNTELPQRIRPGMSERQIALEALQLHIEHGFMGFTRMSAFGEENFLGSVSAGDNGNFPMHFNGPIGAVGAHPAQPGVGGHPRAIWRKGQPLCADFVFNLEGYNSDITRSFWAGPPASVPDAVRRAHDACVEVHEKLRDLMRPGALPEELWAAAVEFMKSRGLFEGFMGYGPNKVPFAGHGIGLTVDEQPVLAARFIAPLEEGMTIAVEPKIGLPGIGMVGVENVIEVTPQGGKCLTGGNMELRCIE